MGLCGKMSKTLVFQLLTAVIFNFILSVHTLEVDLTVDVKPGHEECFYEEIKKPTSLEVEYQVGLTFLQIADKVFLLANLYTTNLGFIKFNVPCYHLFAKVFNTLNRLHDRLVLAHELDTIQAIVKLLIHTINQKSKLTKTDSFYWPL